MIIASLNRDGEIFQIEADPKLLESKQVTGGQLIAPVVDEVTFQFDDCGHLLLAQVKFSHHG